MKKIISLIIALSMVVLIAFVAASCSNNVTTSANTGSVTDVPSTQGGADKETTGKEQTVNTDKPSVDTTSQGEVTTAVETENNGKSKLDGYENVDFGGKEFLFSTFIDVNGTEGFADAPDFWVESYTGDQVNDAVYERNVIMKNLYNCTIKAEGGDSNFNADVAAGTGKFAGLSTAYNIGARYANGSFYNVLKFDTDYTQPWWDQAFFRDLTCNGKLFGVCGSWSIRAMRTPWIMYFNKDVYETKFQDVDIYQMVRDKKWTFDAMVEFISKIKNDTDGDQEYKAGAEDNSDIMGLVTTAHIYRTFFFSSGLRMVTSNYGTFKCAFDDPNGPDIVDKLVEVVKTEGFSTAGYTMADNCIMSGTTLFVANILGQLYNYKDAENLRLGIIPCPLYREGGDYATYCDNHACFLGLTTSYANMDELADFITLLAFHSYKLVYPEFINQIKYTFASDEDSSEMLDIIMQSRTYDAGYFLSLSDSFFGAYQSMVETGKNQWAQAIARHVKTTNSKIADFEAKIAQIDDNY